MKLTQEYAVDIEGRFKYGTIFVVALIAIVIVRLYYLQVIKGAYYHFFSTQNSIKEITIPAARGMIFDRRGQVLVDNRPSFDVVVIPQYVADPEHMFASLSALLNIPREELDNIWAKRHSQPKYQPLVVKRDATPDDVALIRSRKNPWYDGDDPYDLRGVDVIVGYQRSYPDSNIATHVLGYVREIDKDRLEKLSKLHPQKYKSGDLAGIRGIEERWDFLLRGEDGYEQRIVNAVGREVDYQGIASGLEKRPAIPGTNLRLTIDKDLQEVLRDMYGDRKGGAVAIDVRTGGILAMYSSPSYDLNKLASAIGGQYWQEISSHPDKYLLNRAIQGGYPPASTYKILTAIAALSEKVVKPEENITCRGAFLFGGRPYKCWAKGGHGPISVHRAIVSSCDVYFYVAGLRAGVDNLAKYAKMFNFGRKTGVPLEGESSGLIPTSEWKLKRFGIPWQQGETISISIGQGYDVVTPIQNAYFTSIVAGGGKIPQLHLVDAAFDASGGEPYRWEAPKDEQRVDVDPSILKIVKDAMTGVVSEGGTGHRLSRLKISIGGKTGTAQTMSMEAAAKCSGEKCRDHGWFIGFAPTDKPEIAAAVIVEHGGFGASAAAPIVGALFERYYDIEHGGQEKPDKKNEKSPEKRQVF